MAIQDKIISVKKNKFNRKYDVFISYRRKDGGYLTRMLYEVLRKQGYATFFDREEMRSGPFDEQIFSVIKDKNCKDVIIVLSKEYFHASSDEDYVLKELQCAIENGKHIVAIETTGYIAPDVTPQGFEALFDATVIPHIRLSDSFFQESINRFLSKELHPKKWYQKQAYLLFHTRNSLIHLYLVLPLLIFTIFLATRKLISFYDDIQQNRTKEQIEVWYQTGAWNDIIGSERSNEVKNLDANTLFYYSQAYHNLQMKQEALYYDQSFIEKFPNDYRGYLNLYNYYYELDSLEKAKQYLVEAIPKSPNEIKMDLENILISVLHKQKKDSLAYVEARASFQEQANNILALESMCAYFMNRSEKDSLKKYANIMLSIDEKNRNARLFKIISSEMLKDTMNMIKDCEFLIKNKLADSNDIYYLAQLYLAKGGTDSAEEIIAQMDTVDSQNRSKYWETKGDIWAVRKNSIKANNAYHLAISSDETNQKALSKLLQLDRK